MQGLADHRLGKMPTSSPTASCRSREIFLTLAASLGFQTHKGDVKCAFLQGDLDEQHVDDNDDDDFKIESAQPVSDTFCGRVPELSRKMQLEHHQCVRWLKAVYGLVKAPRRWYHRVATDLRHMGGEESLMDLCLWTFRSEKGVIQAVFGVCRAVTSIWKKRIFDGINNLYELGTWESRVFTQCGARSTEAYDKHTESEFETSFTEYVKEISRINLPSHRRRGRTSQITPLELSQLRALNGQLLWSGMQCLPQLLALLSQVMGQTPKATVDTIYELNKLARKATVWAKTPLKDHAHQSPVVVAYADPGWTTRPDGNSQGRQPVFIVNAELLEGNESNGKIVIGSGNTRSRRRPMMKLSTYAFD